MCRVRLLGLALLLAAWPVHALGGEPPPEHPGGAAWEVPAGPAAWTRSDLTPVAGQWIVRHEAPDALSWVEARLFPAEPGERPAAAMLQQAVTHWFHAAHGITGPAVGLVDARSHSLWGCASADATLSTVWKGQAVSGTARVVRLNEHQWALALGVAPRAQSDALAQVRRFVQGLEPLEPKFYFPRFHAGDEMDRVVARGEDGAVVHAGDLMAVQLVLEASSGTRFAIAQRPYVEHALLADVTKGGPAALKGYVEVGSFVRASMAQNPDEREAALHALGKRVIQALVARAERERYAPAIELLTTLDRLHRVVVGDAETGLRQGVVGSALEMAAFLASVALDVPQQIRESDRQQWLATLQAAWPTLEAAEQEAWRRRASAWAELRRAWDLTAPEARKRFRRTVALGLADPASLAGGEGPAASDRDLKSWMEARSDPERAAVLQRALALSPAEQDEWTLILGVGADGLQLGW